MSTKKLIKALGLIIVVALLAAALPLQAKAEGQPGEVWVCTTGDCGHPGVSYNTIQAGINAVAEGGTVNVAAGTYTEQLLIQKNLTLIGAGIGQTIVKAPTSGRATAPGYTSQVWTADNWQTDYLLAAYPTDPVSGTPISVKVSGFTFDANGQSHIGDRFTGVYFRKVFNSDIGAAGLFLSEIKGFSASDPSVTGIRVMESSKLTLSGNQVKDYTILGIVVYGTDNLVDPIVTTAGNTLTPAGNAEGIQYRFINSETDYSGTISNNIINGGNIPIASSTSDHILIQGNTINGGGNGIMLETSAYITVSENIITGCTYNGVYVQSAWGLSHDNLISNNTISNVHSGDTSTLGACGWGIGVDSYYGAVTNTTIEGNTVTGNDAGIVFYGVDATNVAHYNKLSGNSPYDLGNSNADVTIDAMANWWGATSGPASGKISGNVSSNPWCYNEACTELWVAPGGSIQDAIDLAPEEGVVHVAAGTYAEQLTIAKALTLLGPNAGISAGVNPGARGAEAIVTFPASPVLDPESEEIAVFNANVDNVTIDGFTIEGNCVTDGVGINGDDDAMIVKNNIVKNFPRIGIINSSYEYVDGVWNYNFYNAGIVIENNLVISDAANCYTDYSGIYMQGATGLVQGNIVDDARRGIQVQPYNNPSTVQGVVQNNLFRGFRSPIYFNYSENANVNWLIKDNIAEGIPVPTGSEVTTWSGINTQTFYAGNVSFEENQVLYGTTNATTKYLYEEINVTGGTADASPNWWGSILGPAEGTFIDLGSDTPYDPWCGDAACSFLVSGTEPTGSGIFVQNGQLVIKGQVTVTGGITINEPHIFVKFLPGAVVVNNSPCFTVNASYTQIEGSAGAKCIPTGGANGINVAAGLTDIRVAKLEIDGTGQTTGDGIHFVGAVTDVLLVDNFIHDLDGNGVYFGGQPDGEQDIHGNLFQNNGNNGIEAGEFTVDATYNSWGSYDGPEAGDGGDGISANVDADPWTHADITVAPVESNTTSRVVTSLANVSGRPTVLKDGKVYHMWYGTDDTHLYHTSSTNPAEFPEGTLVSFGEGETPAEVASPAIIKEGETFYMIAYGEDNTEFALYTSADGNAWTKGQVVFDGTDKFTDFVKVDAPFLFKTETGYRLYFQVKTGSGVTERYNIYAANSTAIGGTYALANGGSPVLSPADSTTAWDGKYVMHPWVVKDGANYYMWFSAHNGTNQRIGVATSTDGLAWTKSEANPVIGPLGEPAVIKDGDIWRIWYLGAGNSVKYQSALNPLDLRQTLAYQVTANLVNVNAADVTLNFPQDLLSIAEITPGPAFNSVTFKTTPDGSIQFIGAKLSEPVEPVTGQNVVLFTVAFHTDIQGSGDIAFGPATFGMPGVGSSSNVYLAASADTASAQVNELPTLTTTFGDAYYLVGDAQTFQVVITNKGTAYANAELRLGVPTDVALTLTTSGYSFSNNVVTLGQLDANETVTLEFSATISSEGPKTISFDVYDGAAPDGLLLFSTVETATVYTKPVISSEDITGPYQVGFEEGFSLHVDNVGDMASPVAFQLHFDFPDGTILKLGASSVTCTSAGCDVPVSLSQGDNTLNFLVTFDEPVSNGTINVTLNDTGTPRAGLATKQFTGLNVYGNIASVTGTVSMQGRTYRGGVLFTLTGGFGFGPYNATSIDQMSNNVAFANLASGSYTISVTQARYLEVPATLGKTINIGTDTSIAALVLRGGDVLETDTVTSIENDVINVNDASLIGTWYGQSITDTPDANFDGKVNILDLALVGGNYNLTSATAYASWTP